MNALEQMAIQALTHRIKRLEENQAQRSAVSILSDRVRHLEKQLSNCREASRNISTQLLAMMNEQLAMKAAGRIRVPREIISKSRVPHAVQYKYSIMRIMHENGMTETDIARQLGIERRGVYHARKNNWKARNLKEAK